MRRIVASWLGLLTADLIGTAILGAFRNRSFARQRPGESQRQSAAPPLTARLVLRQQLFIMSDKLLDFVLGAARDHLPGSLIDDHQPRQGCAGCGVAAGHLKNPAEGALMARVLDD